MIEYVFPLLNRNIDVPPRSLCDPGPVHIMIFGSIIQLLNHRG
jgi:hypothetical protein